MLTFDELKITQDNLPDISRVAASPDSPPERRLLLARAAVPMNPVDVVTTVAFLTEDPADLVSKAARETLAAMPFGVLGEALKVCTAPEVLDTVARRMPSDRQDLWEVVIQNRSTADETVAWIASRAEGHLIDIIANNKMRVQRSSKIVEAVYFNPGARMGLVLNLLEDAVRLGVDISAIPGWEEIVESIHGKDAVKAAKQGLGLPIIEAEPVVSEAPDEPGVEPELLDGDKEPAPVYEVPDEGLGDDGEAPGGVDDDTFARFLKDHLEDSGQEAEKDGPMGGNLLAELNKMSVPQKVRLALLGSESVRRELIRDTRRIVYMSVLKSPRLSEKEVGDFAKNKALNEEIIRTIAINREWTSSYAVKMALVSHPKCPGQLAVNFLRLMQPKDVKGIARSHDVPGFVARAAKQLLDAWERGKRN